MATISVDRTYQDGDVLFESDLDTAFDGIETFLNTTKISDDNIQTSGITASTKLVDASISTSKLADAVITTAKINDAAVTTVKINDGAVTAAKLSTGAKNAALPIGSGLIWYTSLAPTDFLLCDGTAINRTTYASLFAVIGTTYGAGDSSTTFNLPNFNGRSPLGAGAYTDSVSGAITRVLAAEHGAADHVLLASQIPSHKHEVPQSYTIAFSPDFDASGTNRNTEATSSATGGINSTMTRDNANGGNAHNNMQPSLVINFIIKYQ